ncbi:MAG: heme ABC exporter ATP-binding protein CcmA [Paracoccaceae bacterium]|jgi:heme exporter protein A|uniref:heme ABC exporter ATP-binding protein CcmA n=1 Tax=unclassified Seohaeicola TaxID=2641111 RepID=UPI00237B0C11|nr:MULTISPECIES: heme ABC exporter ATP-binding protein CcmA [unclassified Seohaeicola]MDD9706235.1 heme ABC exporter ATP-binding protein CcmA [Seohaeicola sp. 4SK31]MDD9734694.1 heme ABC exporter ATP-binding protein CcmA [Seohaeicola sp. SP36]MDF1708091.1 heme ABC exporter ATP-binding protein CcmA [Paracoccaceae bacterium]MDM7968795.1 heme ABC exporter ATP-binding protein CcmA [Paracoccaceae bacterium]
MELNVTGLSVARGGIPVLEGLDFTLHAGEALILRGPNGVGKTTVLRTVAGLQPPLAGTVGLEREAMAYAGHADGIKTTLTVRENLEFWAEIFATGRIDAALAAFDLVGLSDRAAGALSAGQKRRLGLARMVVTGRPVWVLDEPTVSLDASAVALFAAAVRTHLAGGGMALMATHIDLGLAEARILDVAPYRAKAPAHDDFDGSFL